MNEFIVIAGIGQILLAAASCALPRMLGWRSQTASLDPLTRQVFWIHAGYIVMTNFCLGFVSSSAPSWLLDGTPLARAVCGYASVYWGARLILQLCFVRKNTPPGLAFRFADMAVTVLFLYLSSVYAFAALGSL